MRLLISTMFLVVIAVSACTAVYPVMPQADVDARRTVTAEAAIIVEPTAVVLATEEAPQVACDIKGNVASNGEMIFHVPGGVYYDRVKVDLEQGDAWLCSEGEAVHAGFRKSSR